MAPQVGLEPTTLRLTAGCSAIELLRSVVGRALKARTLSAIIAFEQRRENGSLRTFSVSSTSLESLIDGENATADRVLQKGCRQRSCDSKRIRSGKLVRYF